MNVGETARTTVKASEHWNHTGIVLTAGEKYEFAASGRWVDWYIPHGPEGDPSDSFYMRLLEPRRRVKAENWFALIGAVNADVGTAFVIGVGGVHQLQTSGELTCFANDVEGFYWNNYGEVQLNVTRME